MKPPRYKPAKLKPSDGPLWRIVQEHRPMAAYERDAPEVARILLALIASPNQETDP